ncbi:MAG: alkaline phosphatase [Pyrinomonadaceae bacterium MAG19_C2-C3]|nr:alkaline phosphatase [Pyrinomonadaceae bacterium MAG19_C2-C3]
MRNFLATLLLTTVFCAPVSFAQSVHNHDETDGCTHPSLLLAANSKDRPTIQADGTTVRIRLPERFRVLTGQLFDLRVEATNLADTNATLRVLVDGEDLTDALFSNSAEVTTDNDDQASIDKAWTFRRLNFSSRGLTHAGLLAARPQEVNSGARASGVVGRIFNGTRRDGGAKGGLGTSQGVRVVEAVVTDGGVESRAVSRIGVQDFNLVDRKSIILYIGDAMGTAYRDASRIVAQSVGNGFREGFFDNLQEMDVMPVTGMTYTYSSNAIVPDSANTASAWATGNKTTNNTLGVFPDNNDFKYNGSNTTTQQATKQFALDNPRIETLWEYLKRNHNYKTGVVTTSEVTDATPAGEGGHTLARALQNDIARQYVDGVFTNGATFDVIMGGAKERFLAASAAAGESRPSNEGIAGGRTVANSGDARNLVGELEAKGFTYVQTRAELNALPSGANAPERIIGLFRTGNMNVAYDKLALPRPSDEPAPNFGGFNDQPFLDEMTAKAITTLSKNNSPFILMVEGASVDKQSHPNLAAGQIWDTIELDKAVGVGRNFYNASTQSRANTLLLVTADHDQSMSIIGAVDTNVSGAVQNVISTLPYPNGSRGDNTGAANVVGEVGGFPDYADANGDRYPENTNRVRIKVGYRTGNHTGSSVPISAEGAGALLFTGYYDQTDIFFKMARVLSIRTKNLDAALTEKLNSDNISPDIGIANR